MPGPLRLFSHADPAAELLVFDHRRSRDLVASVAAVLDAVNRERASRASGGSSGPGAPPVALTVVGWSRDRGEARVETRATPVTRIALDTRFDVWLQDFVEIAHAPKRGGGSETLLVDPNRGVGLERFTPALALRWSARWVRLPPAPPDAASGGGNVEVLPSDLLLLGSTVGEAMARFWLERGYGGRHVRVDTGWLAVGHVDEIVSHVVTGPGRCDFALVRASPGRGLVLAAADLDRPRWVRRKSDAFWAHQRVLEARLAAQAEALRRALAAQARPCPDVPVVALPVLFRCEGAPDAPHRCRSERPNAVNLTVVDRHLLVPAPRYAPFARDVRRALEARGQRVHLLDADAPHARRGGIHCATAVRREPRAPQAARAATLRP